MTLFESEVKEPCLVPARQGFSVLYKDRWLYSRFDPEKTVLRNIESLTIQPETLVLAFSPAAGYGLEQLIQKLPESCHILTIECDPYLFAFYARTCPHNARLHHSVANILIPASDDTHRALIKTFRYMDLSHFRRILTVNMSGGTSLYQDFYAQITDLANKTLFSFWKNQLTLNHLGKLFNTNCIKNVPSMTGPTAIPFPAATVTKPILIIGAGPSAEETLGWLEQHPEYRSKVYLLSVDAAVTAIRSHNLIPDGVVAVESQVAIEKAYIGWNTADVEEPHLFADCTSRPSIPRRFSRVSFFATRFWETTLFEESSWVRRYTKMCDKAGIPQIAPQGSVGNAATEIALLLRAPDMPVFVTGLDFSYTPGSTHTKNTPQFNTILHNSHRQRPAANYDAAWNQTALVRKGKGNRMQITGANLEGYAHHFAETYCSTPLLFDLGKTGLPLGIPGVSLDQLDAFLSELMVAPADETGTLAKKVVSAPCHESENNDIHTEGIRFLTDEKNRVEAILEALTGTAPLPEDELLKHIKDGSYLYLHFPDCNRGVTADPDFLKRIKAEAIWFHKQITTALSDME